MSGFVPMLSASPPPMDNSFEMDDDDDDDDSLHQRFPPPKLPVVTASSSSSKAFQCIPSPNDIAMNDDDDDDDFGDFGTVAPTPFSNNQKENAPPPPLSEPTYSVSFSTTNKFSTASQPFSSFLSNANFTEIPDFGFEGRSDLNRNPSPSSSSSILRNELTLSAVSAKGEMIENDDDDDDIDGDDDDDDDDRFICKPSLNHATTSSNTSAKSSPTTTCSSSTQITAFDGSDAGVEAVSLAASDGGVEALSLADSGLCSDASPVPKSASGSPSDLPAVEIFERISENDDSTFEDADDTKINCDADEVFCSQIKDEDDDEDVEEDARDDTTLISGDLKFEVLLSSLLGVSDADKKDDDDFGEFGSGSSRPDSFLRVHDGAIDAGKSESPSEASSPQRLLGKGGGREGDDGKKICRDSLISNGLDGDDDFQDFQADFAHSNLDETSAPFSVSSDAINDVKRNPGDVTAIDATSDGVTDVDVGSNGVEALDGGEDVILKEIDSALGNRVSDLCAASSVDSFPSKDVDENDDDDFAGFTGANDINFAAKTTVDLTVISIASSGEDDDDFGVFSAPPPASSVISSAVAADSPHPTSNSIPEVTTEVNEVAPSSSFVALKGKLKPNEITWDDDDDEDDHFRFDGEDDDDDDDDGDVIAPPSKFQSNPFKSIEDGADDAGDDDFQDFADFAAAASLASTEPRSEVSDATETFLSHQLRVDELRQSDQTSPTRTCLLASAAETSDHKLGNEDENEEDEDGLQADSSRGHLNPFSASKEAELEEDQFEFESQPHGGIEDEDAEAEDDGDEWNAFGDPIKDEQTSATSDDWGTNLEWGDAGGGGGVGKLPAADDIAGDFDVGWADHGWGEGENIDAEKEKLEDSNGEEGWAAFGSPAVAIDSGSSIARENGEKDDDGDDDGWADFAERKDDKQPRLSSSTSTSPPSSFLSLMGPSMISAAMADCFPTGVNHLSFSYDAFPKGIPKKPEPKPDISLDNGLNVLSKLVDIDTALAISYHWLRTSMKTQLYWAIGVDNRNIMTAPHKKQVPIFASGLGSSVLEPNKRNSNSSTPSHTSSHGDPQQKQQDDLTQQHSSATSLSSSAYSAPKTMSASNRPLVIHPEPPELPPSLSGGTKSRGTNLQQQQQQFMASDVASPQQMLVDTTGSKALNIEDMKKMADSKPLDRIKKDSIPPVEFDWRTSGLQNPLDTFASESKEDDGVSSRSSTNESMITTLEAEMLKDVSNGSLVEISKPVVTLHPLLAKLQSTAESTASKKSAKSNTNLCLEVTSLLKNLPDLSFMGAQVLMFPVHNDEPSPPSKSTAPSSDSSASTTDCIPSRGTTMSDKGLEPSSTTLTTTTTTTLTSTATTNMNDSLHNGVCTISYS